jgi:hypothetical protein
MQMKKSRRSLRKNNFQFTINGGWHELPLRAGMAFVVLPRCRTDGVDNTAMDFFAMRGLCAGSLAGSTAQSKTFA